jgi:hypothetical protein
MPRKPEPKFIVKYVKKDIPLEEQKVMYERFLKHLVKVVKEQEALEEKTKGHKNV